MDQVNRIISIGELQVLRIKTRKDDEETSGKTWPTSDEKIQDIMLPFLVSRWKMYFTPG
jgi:hypothetical protein